MVQGLLLADSSEKMDSMNLLLYMAPIAALLLIPAIMISEPTVLFVAREQAYADHSEPAIAYQLPFSITPQSYTADPWHFGSVGFLPALALNATLAFFVNLSNFMVTKHTSALTLQAGCPARPSLLLLQPPMIHCDSPVIDML